MPDMEKEFITCKPSDRDAWRCLCGNEPCEDGFFTCDENGDEVEPTAKDWKTGLYVCNGCGRMINPDTLEVVGTRKQTDAAAVR
jgi:hypothetical protein